MILHLDIIIGDFDYWHDIEIIPEIECEPFLYDVVNLTFDAQVHPNPV